MKSFDDDGLCGNKRRLKNPNCSVVRRFPASMASLGVRHQPKSRCVHFERFPVVCCQDDEVSNPTRPL